MFRSCQNDIAKRLSRAPAVSRRDGFVLLKSQRCPRNYASKLERIVSGLELFPRNANKVAFDSMVLQAISKAFALARAALLLFDRGFPDEAYGLSRSLVECSVGLRYITAEPDDQERRTREFIRFDETEQNYWLDQARQHLSDPVRLQEIEFSHLAQELDAKHLDPKDAFRHWSSHRAFIWDVMRQPHPLDPPNITPQQSKMAFAVDYHAPS
jgi:Family of unknown function (DUF5677)